MLNDLEIALLEEDTDEVTAYLEEIDRRTAAAAYAKAADDFGFKTVEFGGVIYASLAEAALVLGYSEPSGMAKLLERYQIYTLSVGSFGHSVRSKTQNRLGLKAKDNSTKLIPWEGFLVAGMYSQNEAASKVKLYLLKMEREARIALDQAQPDALAVRMANLKELSEVTKAVAVAEKLPDELRSMISVPLKKVIGQTLPLHQQTNLGLN